MAIQGLENELMKRNEACLMHVMVMKRGDGW